MLALLGSVRGAVLATLALAATVAVAGLWLDWRHLQAKLAGQAAQLAAAQAINAANLETLNRLRADAAHAAAAALRDRAAAAGRERERTLIDQEIRDAAPEDDAPTAPVLRRAVERLYGSPAAAGQDRRGAADGAGDASRLRPGPGAP